MGPRGPARGFIALRFVDTKTKKPQQVPINPAVRAVLTSQKHQARFQDSQPHGVVENFRTEFTVSRRRCCHGHENCRAQFGKDEEAV